MSRKFRFRVSRSDGDEPEAESPPPDPFAGSVVPDPGLTPDERAGAEDEARQGIPASAATTPSPGERRVRARFREAMADVRVRAEAALGRLKAEQGETGSHAVRLEAEAAREREQLRALADVDAEAQRLEDRFQRVRAANAELAGFRRERGIPDHVRPRPKSNGWIWLLAIVAAAETTANGVLLHSASTEGIVSNWLFAALVTAMNVGLLGWIVGDLIFRRLPGSTGGRRWLLGGALLPCLALAVVLHFGFAHYRDAVSALDASLAEAVLDLDDIDAGTATVADALPPLTVEEAVIGELRAQFLPWTPGATFADGPVAAGRVGYQAADGGLVRARDPLAGRFDGWRSVLLLGVGFAGLLLASWKWYGGREPVPHFARLHQAREEAAAELQREYEKALLSVTDEERGHHERLAGPEREISGLAARLGQLDAARRNVLARESERLRLIAESGASAIEDFREANRQRRLSNDPPPAFWRSAWSPETPDRDAEEEAQWRRGREENLRRVEEVSERMRTAGAHHASGAAEAFAEARERLAHAARITGSRRRPTADRSTIHLVPTRRLETAP